jgi:hypothetical protein
MLSREIIILSRPGFELSYYHLATLKAMGGAKTYAARPLGTPGCSAVERGVMFGVDSGTEARYSAPANEEPSDDAQRRHRIRYP